MNRVSGLGVAMLALGLLIGSGALVSANGILPGWFIPVCAGAAIVLAFRAPRDQRYTYVLSGIALIVGSATMDRAVKAWVWSLCGVALILVRWCTAPGVTTIRTGHPQWILWLIAVVLIASVLFFV